MSISNEIILDLIEFIFIVVILIFVLVDFGFNIEELVPALASAFSPVSLDQCQYSVLDCSLHP